MKLSAVDIAIILGYFLTVILIGLWVSRRGVKDLDSYFLGSKSLPWYLRGISDASGMFDISGTMWMCICLIALPIYLVLRQWAWVGAIAATLGITSLIIKFNWYDKLEKAPAGCVRREQLLPKPQRSNESTLTPVRRNHCGSSVLPVAR